MLKKFFNVFLSCFLIAGLLFSPVASFAERNKPPLGSQINWAHPLSRGLVGCWLMNEGGGLKTNNLVTNKKASLNNGANWVIKKSGYACQFDGVDDEISSSLIANYKAMTIVTKVNIAALGVAPYQFSRLVSSRNYNNGGYFEFTVNNNTTTSINRLSFSVNYATVDLLRDTADNYFSLLTDTTFGVTWSGSATAAGNIHLYRNGIKTLTYTQTIDGTGGRVNETYPIRLGNLDGTIERPLNGLMYYCYIYNRALSPQEIQQLYIDPYCFIKQSYKLYYAPAAGGATNDVWGWMDGNATTDIFGMVD
jgi:hypothetical protein